MGGGSIGISPISSASEEESPWAIVAYGFICVILRLAVLRDHWPVTDGQTDRRRQRTALA